MRKTWSNIPTIIIEMTYLPVNFSRYVFLQYDVGVDIASGLVSVFEECSSDMMSRSSVVVPMLNATIHAKIIMPRVPL